MYTYKELKKKIAEAERAVEIDGFIGNELYDNIIDDSLVEFIRSKVKSLLNDTEDLEEIDLLNDIEMQCEHYLEFDLMNEDPIFDVNYPLDMGYDDYDYDVYDDDY